MGDPDTSDDAKSAAGFYGGFGDAPYGAPGLPGDLFFWTMAAPSWVGKSVAERFWQRVLKTPTCWEWLGGVTGSARHGRFKIGQRTHATHRWSWEVHNGSSPGEMNVLHTCDVGWCVNPEHLYLGTAQDNVDDQHERMRVRFPGAPSKISQADVADIKRLYASGVKQKQLAGDYGIGQPHVSKIVNTRRRAGLEWPPLPLRGSRWLRVTDVRVERVGEISISDVLAEGIPINEWVDCEMGCVADEHCTTAANATIGGFQSGWDSIYAKRGLDWEANPWTWVVVFERHAGPGAR